MRSKLIELADITGVPIKEFVKKIPRSRIEREIHANELVLRMSQRYIIDADSVQTGDIVTLDLTSEEPWFQRNACKVNAGLGLFSEALEDELIGREAGDIFTVDIDDNTVGVSILAVQRVIIPKFDDELINRLKPDGADCVAAYRKVQEEELLGYYREKYLNWYVRQVFDKWCAVSKWEIDEGELEEMIQRFDPDSLQSEDFEDAVIEDSIFFIKSELISEKLFSNDNSSSKEDVLEYVRPYVEPYYSIEIAEEE